MHEDIHQHKTFLISSIVFIDLEVDSDGQKVLDYGAVWCDERCLHAHSQPEFFEFVAGAEFICGHNIFAHDLRYIEKDLAAAGLADAGIIDTLHFSPLLFPRRPYHKLVKDDKLQPDELNNPLNDALKAKELLLEEIDAFNQLNAAFQEILYQLLHKQCEFSAFFKLLNFTGREHDLKQLINAEFAGKICENADFTTLIENNPVELAYCLALINVFSGDSKEKPDSSSITPPWVSKNYPDVEKIMLQLRNQPCQASCSYCQNYLDIYSGLKRWFGYDAFRRYDDEPLQEKAIKAVINENRSILAVFPTGGGKSITFQLPALMAGENTHALTVVISPLQSLMKDQIDNLEKSHRITSAVTINGLLDPIERQKAYERVEEGSASILYISPESLRSRSIERLLFGRSIARFVIDEAHCFSAWGQDFRVDYLFIGEFIKHLQQHKQCRRQIPVSCFTATAKPQVIADIQNYFRKTLGLELQTFTASGRRKNLHFKAIAVETAQEKYNNVRRLIDEKNCPTIVYVSRTKKAMELAEKLSADGSPALAFHGKMDAQTKIQNQNDFIRGNVNIIVATSAFGMGVDKKDVGLIIHFDISDSLENYIQEAGRAGRDEAINADCYVLFNEEDLTKHFILLNQTRVNKNEIQQIWEAIREITRLRANASASALEIARKAGWDDNVSEIETRVITAIAALEDAGFLKRGQNNPRVYANSIQVANVVEAREKIEQSPAFSEADRENAVRIMQKLISSQKRSVAQGEDGESRVDYIADHLGMRQKDVIRLIGMLREEKILGDARDLTGTLADVSKSHINERSFNRALETYFELENFLQKKITEESAIYNIKELNEEALNQGIKHSVVNKIKTLVNFWAIKNWLKQRAVDPARQKLKLKLCETRLVIESRLAARQEVARFIMRHFFRQKTAADTNSKELKFSVLELKTAFANEKSLFNNKASNGDIEDALFFLSRIGAISLEGGFMVIYNRLYIERLELSNLKKYRKDHYQKLADYYKSKIQQIHIAGEYARLQLKEYAQALQFVEDYFSKPYEEFLNQYFPGARREELNRNITPAKFSQLFGELSTRQFEIINDKDTQNIVVAAGPGSGKTRVLVHKLASLLLLEEVKSEQLLMLTFSRAAATEFKKRLLALIGNAANRVEIKTFHSYCFDLLGKPGNIENSETVVGEAVKAINSKQVEKNRITKVVLVIDEAQDISEPEFELIKALQEVNEKMRIIAVGDDDQNIFEFRKASSRYMKELLQNESACMYELLENYRSSTGLVEAANCFTRSLPERLKNKPLVSKNPQTGHIRLVRHTSNHIPVALVEDLASCRPEGSLCILTHTNDQAMQLVSLLRQQGLPGRLIQSNDRFNLLNLLEIRDFIDAIEASGTEYVISAKIWNNARNNLLQKYAGSGNLPILRRLIDDFAAVNPNQKFKSDLIEFINESKLEDFQTAENETILVSTIHKAKGKEFDNVWLLLENFSLQKSEAKRALYVAITRARTGLVIHHNSTELENMLGNVDASEIDRKTYPDPDTLLLEIGFKDVHLDYFFKCQGALDCLQSGTDLAVTEVGCITVAGKPCLKFSHNLIIRLKELELQGYRPVGAKVAFVVYWKKTNSEDGSEIKILLPVLTLQRQMPSQGL